MKKSLELRSLYGREVLPYLDDLASLRIQVFREFPYLYEGTERYEKEYLQYYVRSPRSLVVLALDQQKQVIGATTALPLSDADKDFQQPFIQSAYPPDNVFYFGESVLLPEWRGQGVGHRFFDLREEHAASQGFSITAFCAVVRAVTHPLRPEGYRPHDRFWMGRGYQCQSEMYCNFPWKDIDQPKESVKKLLFWLKQLRGNYSDANPGS